MLQKYTGGPVACNAYLLRGPEGYVMIDAPLGAVDWLEKTLPHGEKLLHLLITHQHFDHVQGAAEVQRRTGCSIHAYAAHSKELTLELLFGREVGVSPFTVNDVFGGQTRADWGGLRWELCHIPGHSTDGMAYLLPELKTMFVGDILFAGGIGRTDFPGGSTSTLVRGIRQQLMSRGDGWAVYPGHGPQTSTEEERDTNPYL